MTRKFIENPARCGVPDVHEPVSGTSSDLTAIRGPGAPQKVLFKVVSAPLEYLHTPITIVTVNFTYDSMIIEKMLNCSKVQTFERLHNVIEKDNAIL